MSQDKAKTPAASPPAKPPAQSVPLERLDTTSRSGVKGETPLLPAQAKK
jgi:hypothetical protein